MILNKVYELKKHKKGEGEREKKEDLRKSISLVFKLGWEVKFWWKVKADFVCTYEFTTVGRYLILIMHLLDIMYPTLKP